MHVYLLNNILTSLVKLALSPLIFLPTTYCLLGLPVPTIDDQSENPMIAAIRNTAHKIKCILKARRYLDFYVGDIDAIYTSAAQLRDEIDATLNDIGKMLSQRKR